MVVNTRASGTLKGKRMGEVYRFTLMVQFTKDIGQLISHMAGADLYTRMEMFTLVSGRQIKHTDLEFMSMKMVLVTKVNGRMTCIMVRARNFSLMTQLMKGSLSRAKNMDEANLNGLMLHPTKDNSSKT